MLVRMISSRFLASLAAICYWLARKQIFVDSFSPFYCFKGYELDFNNREINGNRLVLGQFCPTESDYNQTSVFWLRFGFQAAWCFEPLVVYFYEKRPSSILQYASLIAPLIAPLKFILKSVLVESSIPSERILSILYKKFMNQNRSSSILDLLFIFCFSVLFHL